VDRRTRLVAVPELFLGLLAIGIAFVVVAQILAGTIRDVRHTRDTLSVTASARVPISANLVTWTLAVASEDVATARAARRERRAVGRVRKFLLSVGVPAEAIRPSVIASEVVVIRLPRHRRLVRYRVSQQIEVRTKQIDVVEAAATRVGSLLEQGVDVSAEPLAYLSTQLAQAKLTALEQATAEARRRAEILAHGLGGKLGRMRSSSQGVYQVTPRDSTDVSDYGINDTSSRDKDVNAVVSATFAVNR
jgi:uncharacterized protein